MKKLSFTLIPTIVALAYMLCKYLAFLATTQMYVISPTFVPEVLIYLALCGCDLGLNVSPLRSSPTPLADRR
jgi:hypothetical protein